MASYPFSKLPPPNSVSTAGSGSELQSPPRRRAAKAVANEAGKMSKITIAVVVIAVSFMTALSAVALLSLGQGAGVGVTEIARAPLPAAADEIAQANPESEATNARLLVTAVADDDATPARLFAPAEVLGETADDPRIAPPRASAIEAIRTATQASETIATADDSLFVNESGTHQMTISADWDGPVRKTTESTQFNILDVHQFSSTTVITWDVSIDEDPQSAHEVIEAEAALGTMTVEAITSTVGDDGEEVVVGSLVSSDEQNRSILVVHQADTGYAAAYLTAPAEHYDDALLSYAAHVESIRYIG